MKNLLVLTLLTFTGYQGVSQTYISQQEAIDDLNFYNQSLLEIHVNPFQFVTKEDYYARQRRIQEELSDSVEVRKFISDLSSLAAMMEDAHSGPAYQQPLFSEEAKKNQFFPYKTVLHDHRLYIAKDSSLSSDIAPGSEIIEINNRSVNELLTKFRKNIGGTEGHKEETINRLFFHYLFIEGIEAPFQVDYINPSGSKSMIVLNEGITHLQGLLRAFPAFAQGNHYRIIDNRLGYIKFNSMVGSVQEWMELLNIAFEEFRAKDISTVAVDIRDNAGGDSTFGDVLFGFLSSKEFMLLGYRQWKVSQQYKKYLTENGNLDHEYLNQEVGTLWRWKSCETAASLVTPEERFDGKVYLLIGPWTFSSGMMVADAAKHFQLAELVGEPTGENSTDFGEVLSLKLPNSGVVMNLTTSMDIGADCDPEKFSPVTPDVHIKGDLKELLHGRDIPLEYILKKVSGQE